MHAMYRPVKFKYVYLFATLYIFTLTIPSSMAIYWSFGDALLQNSNALSLLPKSPARDVAVLLMLIHQVATLGTPEFQCSLFIQILSLAWGDKSLNRYGLWAAVYHSGICGDAIVLRMGEDPGGAPGEQHAAASFLSGARHPAHLVPCHRLPLLRGHQLRRGLLAGHLHCIHNPLPSAHGVLPQQISSSGNHFTPKTNAHFNAIIEAF